MTKPFQVQDEFFKKAKKEGLRARSAFKLDEIQKQFKLIKQGDAVLDIGAAPGSFLQKIIEYIGPQGRAIGFDIQKIKPLPAKNIYTFVANIYDLNLIKKNLTKIGTEKFDVITSDIAPKTTGIKIIDQCKSIELNQEILKLAKVFLKIGGHLVLKIFRGEDFRPFYKTIKNSFKQVKIFKPKSSRDRSFETYLVCLNKK